MNAEIKAAWLQALRSGDYTQARSALRTEHGFCCLGVLCDVFAKRGQGFWEGYTFYYEIDDHSDAFLPQGVLKAACVAHSTGQYREGNLANHNDNGMSFDDIANIIEKNF